MLNRRQKKVLFCVVNEYIRNRKPVSSSRVLESTDISHSSATIRNDLKKLEYLGYVHHVHTSSGRVPTDKGYRFYIDSISDLLKDIKSSTEVDSLTAYPRLNITTLLNHAAVLISRTLPVVSVITKPRTDTLKIKAIRLHKTSIDYITVVLITEIGMVDAQTVLERISEDTLIAVEKFLNMSLVGRTVDDISNHLKDSEAQRKWKGTSVESVFDILKSIIEEATSETHVIRGLGNVISDDLVSQRSLKRLVLTLESPKAFSSFLQGFGSIKEMKVFVGEEHSQEGMKDFASFVTPYKVYEENVGYVVVIGSKAIDYQKAISMTKYVGNRLTEMLTFLSRFGRIQK